MKQLSFLLFSIFALTACNALPIEKHSGDLTVTIVPGKSWMHRFSFLVKNPPQFAIWLEDEDGEYLETLFVTRKTATQGWIFNDGNRRIESLPVWAHQRNIVEDDGLLLPSKDNPLADGITGATPKSSTEIVLRPNENSNPFYILFEVNHSTDFNETWPENASEGDKGWSGGSYGSGQPSLVYRVLIDPMDSGPWTLELIGHGSADGSSGEISPNLNEITSALDIVEAVTVEKE